MDVKWLQRRLLEKRRNTPNEQESPRTTTTTKTPKDEVVGLLGSKLSSMSMEDRSRGLHDLHGVSELEEETPEMLQSKVKEMTNALELSCSSSSRGNHQQNQNIVAYKKALSMSADYVESLKVLFLRSECYNGQAAADRMIRFFDLKSELFGEEKLVRDITIEDLGREETDAVNRGAVQLLPQRDRAGRAVVFVCGKTQIEYSVCAMDEETQKRGVVGIFWGVWQQNREPGRPFAYWKNLNSVPWRVVAVHFCVSQNASMLTPTIICLCKAMENRSLCRFRLHEGTEIECVYNLMTFGIPKDALPLTAEGGSLDLSSHHKMLKVLRNRESTHKGHSDAVNQSTKEELGTLQKIEDDATMAILVPGPMDVLMGRGRHPRSWPGSLRLHNLLLQYRDSYEKGHKSEKTAIREMVLRDMKEAGCRFLATEDNGYILCSDAMAREKISHGFRNLRLKHTNNGKNSADSDSKKRSLENQD